MCRAATRCAFALLLLMMRQAKREEGRDGGGDVAKGCRQFMLHTLLFVGCFTLGGSCKNLYLSSIYCMRVVVRFCCKYFALLMVCYYTRVWVCVKVVLCYAIYVVLGCVESIVFHLSRHLVANNCCCSCCNMRAHK